MASRRQRHPFAYIHKAIPEPEEHLVIQRPEAAFQHSICGGGVAHTARLHVPESHQPYLIRRKGLFQFHCPAVKIHTCGQGIQARLPFAKVHAAALSRKGNLPRPCHHRPGQARYSSRLQTRPQVKAEYCPHLIPLKQTGFANGLCTAGGFFRGLKYQQYVIAQAVFFRKPAAQLQYHGHVTVMAAGMHTALMYRCKGQPCLFADGQRVHIRPKRYGALPSPVKVAADSTAKGRKHIKAQLCKLCFYVSFGFWQAVVQLRYTVQGAPVLCHGGKGCHFCVFLRYF